MKHFWKGFHATKSAAPVRFKKHVIVLYWSPEDPRSSTFRAGVQNLSIRHPSVSVKVIDVSKNPLKPSQHKVLSVPTAILLRDGREVDRVNVDDGATLLETLFRKAQT